MIGRGVLVGEEAPVVRATRLGGETEMIGDGAIDEDDAFARRENLDRSA